MHLPDAAARFAKKCTRCARIRAKSRRRQNLRKLLEGSTLIDIPYHLVPRFRTWLADSWSDAEDQRQHFDIAWDYVPPSSATAARLFTSRFLPFKGGKKHQPQDAYCLRCIPQVHGAVRDALAQACRVIDIELNAVTDNPLIFPGCGRTRGHRGSGRFGRPLSRHADRAGDELRQGGDSSAGVDLRAAHSTSSSIRRRATACPRS